MNRLLAHSIDACTLSAGPPRRRRQGFGRAFFTALGLSLLALTYFALRA